MNIQRLLMNLKYISDPMYFQKLIWLSFIDLLGSTTMTLELPEEKIATIISSFAQEMAYVVKQYGGFVLKFVGDAVLAFLSEKKMH